MAFALDFLLVSSLYRVVYNSFIWYFVSSGVVLFQESEKTVKIVLFMAALAALSNRAGHYIFALWFLSIFFLSFFPHLFSAVADWISTILPHMVWP